MKKWYQYPVGTNDECAEAKVFNRLVRHYAWKKFRAGAFAILLLGAIALAPIFILVGLSQYLPFDWLPMVCAGAGIIISILIIRKLNRSTLLSRYLPALPKCNFCGGDFEEVTDTDGDEFLVCQHCKAHGIIGVMSR